MVIALFGQTTNPNAILIYFLLRMGISSTRKAFGRESMAQNIFLRREGERQYVIKEKSSEVDDGEFLLLRPNYLAS